jgi:cytochrome c553
MKKLVLPAAVLTLLLCGPAIAGDSAAGQALSKTCAACHGAEGNSASAEFPRLAGQHEDYLIRALKDYQSGARKNPIMAPLAANLTPRDIDDLAAFFSNQKGLATKH